MAQGGDPRSRLLSALNRTLQSREFLLLALGLLGIANYLVRVWMLGRYAAPSSADHGIYLADAHALLGTDVTGFGSAYPPVFLLALVALLSFLGPIPAVQILAPVGALILPFPFYKIVSRYTTKPWAFLGTLLFVLNEGYSEMTGWGGGPDLLAIAFMLASLAFFLSYLDSPNRRDLVLAGLFAGLVVGTHHLTALVYLGTLLMWMMLEALRSRSVATFMPFVKLAGWSALFSLPFVPYYIGFGSGIAPQMTPVWPDALEGLPAATVFLFRESWILWGVVGILSLAAGVRWLRDRPEGSLFLSFVAISFFLASAVLQDNPTRSLYYLYIPLVATFPAFFRWFPKPGTPELSPRSRQITAALLVTFVVLSSAVFVGQSMGRMSVAVDWYHAINQPEVEALDWLRTNTPADAVVATAGLPFYRSPEGTRYAWWIEGYAERHSFYGGNPIYAALGPERAMVESANQYFAGDYGEQGPSLRFAENAPSALANPAVSVRTPSGFETAFFMSDADTTISYAPGNGSVGVRTWAPYYQVPVVQPTWAGPSQDVLRVPRGDGVVSFVRQESLNASSVTVSLDIRSTNGTLVSVDLPVWAGWWMMFQETRAQGNRVTGVLEDGAGDEFPFEVLFEAAPPTMVFVNTTNEDPRWGQPGILTGILVRAVPAGSAASLALNITLTFPASTGSPASRWDAPSIGALYSVDFVFLNRNIAEMYYRFEEDSQHFRRVYGNDDIVIYAVES